MDVLEQYWQKGGTYVIPVEIINQIKGEFEEKEQEIERLNKKLEEKEAILGGIQQLEAEIERLNKRYKEIYDGYIAIAEELSDTAIENEQLHSIIKEARELLNQEWYSVLRKRTITKVKEILDKVEEK